MDHEQYQDLDALLRGDEEASSLYLSLPDYVRDQIGTRADNIHSYNSLKDYAENLLRGDD